MKLACFLAVLVVAPLSVAAQNGASRGVAGMEGIGANTQTRTFTVTISNTCPVDMKAQHLSDGDLIKTGDRHPRGLGQWLHLTLRKADATADGPAAKNATLAVRGWTAKPRVAGAAMKNRDTSNAERKIQVTLKPGPDGTATADLWAEGLTAVDSLELLSVSYADGSTWTPGAGNRCSARPDPLMLIGQ